MIPACQGHGKVRVGIRLLILAWTLVATACAANSRARFQDGNRAYVAGEFEGAVEAYGEAPASAETFYNLGNAQYRLERYDEARGSFEAAASLAGTDALRSRSWYNLGNCLVKTAEGLREGNAQAALATCREAAWLYRTALQYDPEFRDAAYNLEVSQRIAAAMAEDIRAQEANDNQEDPNQGEGESDEDSDRSEDDDMEYDESDQDADQYQEADPFGDFSEYEEIRGVPPPNQTEMDILAEELRNQALRQEKRAGEYKAVERDW